jgi:hypothetical protein
MSKKKLEGDVRFALQKKNLKQGDHFKVEAKIGGGKKSVCVEFKDSNHIDEHRGHLEQLATDGGFTIELKAAA